MAHQFTGSWTRTKQASKASTDYDIGDILYNDGTDTVLGTTTSGNIAGICMTDKPSTDATTGDIYIAVPTGENSTFLAAVTGTFTKACEGRRYDLSDELTVNTAASTYKVVKCVKFINSTTGAFAICSPIS